LRTSGSAILTTKSTPPKGPRRVNTGRGSVVWKTFEDDDFESELTSELESRWQSGASEGPMLLQTMKGACKRIWARPLTNICLHSDLPRLSHNMEIVDERSGAVVRRRHNSLSFMHDWTYFGLISS
jgi:hypothetical protein